MLSPKLKVFLQAWLINTLAVLVAARILQGRIHYQSGVDLLVATLVLGLLTAFLRPLLMLLSLPLLILTLGLFTLIINAGLLLLASWLLQPGFRVDGFGSAFWGALIISVVSVFLNALAGTGQARIIVQRGRRPADPKSQDANGPLIDV